MGYITGSQTQPSELHGKYAGIIKMHNNPYGKTLEQVHLLALDSIRRKTSISEVFEEPMVYKPVGLFDVDMKGALPKWQAETTDYALLEI